MTVVVKFVVKILRENWLALVGLVFLITFIMIRAVSFHHFDQVIKLSLAGIRMNWILELSGIFCILISASMNILKKKDHERARYYL